MAFLKKYGKWMFLSLVLVLIAGCARDEEQTQPTPPTRETDDTITPDQIDGTTPPVNDTGTGITDQDGTTTESTKIIANETQQSGYSSGISDPTGRLPGEPGTTNSTV